MTPHGLGTAVIVAALLVAAWCLVTAARDRPIRAPHLVAMAIVQALVTVQIVLAVIHLSQGQRSPEQATFIGYLCAFFVIIPIAGVLARMEPTRWGSVIAGVGGLVVAILVVRLNQVWTGIG